jgi:adenine-specific DNA-methyltransferase
VSKSGTGYAVPLKEVGLADPREALNSARLMARAWAQEVRDETRRVSAACGFTARAIDAYAARLLAVNGQGAELSSPPPGCAGYLLDASTARLADSVGEAAAALPVIEASYLLSVMYTIMLPDRMRAKRGVYYTPPALTRRLIDMATESGVDWATCRVLDPACGGGAFLAPAALRIIRELSACEPPILINNISNRLRGFEIDEFAAWMAQAFLEIALAPVCRSAGRRLPRLVTVCDSLEQEPNGERFDLVIGNPPYGRVTLPPVQRERYKRSLYGHANMYGVFTDLALRWAASRGVIAYVTPTSFLAGEYFKALRGLLAREAPPAAVDFIAARRGVFEDVLQETLLATYQRDGSASTAAVHYVTVAPDGTAAITPAGNFRLPAEPHTPWLLPRIPGHATLIARLSNMPTRLADWGYSVSTGPLVWNRFKNQLRSRPCSGAYPLIWAEAVSTTGRFAHRADKRNHEPYFKIEKGDDWLKTDQPCVLVQRTTAKEQHRRLIAAELPKSFIAAHGAVVIENHLNMVRPYNGDPKVAPAVVAAILNSEIVDRVFRCISGSVAVSAFELEAMPLPTVKEIKAIERLVSRGASRETIERQLHAIYLGEKM